MRNPSSDAWAISSLRLPAVTNTADAFAHNARHCNRVEISAHVVTKSKSLIRRNVRLALISHSHTFTNPLIIYNCVWTGNCVGSNNRSSHKSTVPFEISRNVRKIDCRRAHVFLSKDAGIYYKFPNQTSGVLDLYTLFEDVSCTVDVEVDDNLSIALSQVLI